MQRQTAADILIDAGRDVVAALRADRDRSAEAGAADPTGALVVGTLLVLAVAAAPILVVALVGYAITAARDPDSPVPGFDDWGTICAAGTRGTALLVGIALPVAAVLAGTGLLEIGTGSVALGSVPGPVVGVGIGALGVVTWHAAAVGTAAVAAGSDRAIAWAVRFGRSGVGVRCSVALAGLSGGVGLAAYGLTAIPVVGTVLAAGVCAVGVAVAGSLVGRAVAASGPGNGLVGPGVSEDRLAVPADGSEAPRHGTLDREREQRAPSRRTGRGD